ncbi:hypothetical protein [Paenibacillus sp. 481]|uniref:hypothetical protein n=1 Tax=Paenibacillus sp. 481 TaxID=2835869 RepID=UPI001E3DB8F4|nr:hypothetical protein [Paenibacillus sp. 481]UHA73502.1 hypothetical protein KIK04_23615 [Paenibacillus sp. 481]
MKNKDTLKQFIIKYVNELENDGYSGENINHPPFELTPRDYLQFAETELDKTDNIGLINCVSHIKRAMDCQIDIFFYSYNLYNLFKRKRLGVDKKLEFLREVGVFDSKSLSRLNAIRNRMEHEFEVPKIQDIELYYDLVSAFVSILESHILILEIYAESSWYSTNENGPKRFSISYSLTDQSVKVAWKTNQGEAINLIARSTDIDEFSFFLRVFFLMSKSYVHISKNYIISQLSI